ncbi:TetR/AcrR family transcriptional regulator [Endothiovibrio diazotrophicus]
MSSSTSRPGRRPAGSSDAVRATLLATARRLFAEKGYEAVSVRALAGAAGVTPAMIHYYFGNKEGLYLAVLREALAPTLKRIAGLQAAGRHDRGALAELLQAHMELLLREPWLPPLVAREVLLREGPLREAFATQVAGRMIGGLTELLGEAPPARAGDADLAALSVLAMTIFPFLAHGLVHAVYGIEVNEAFAARWSRFVADRLFNSQPDDGSQP